MWINDKIKVEFLQEVDFQFGQKLIQPHTIASSMPKQRVCKIFKTSSIKKYYEILDKYLSENLV